MKSNQQRANWIIDCALFVVFLVSFFLDLTGLDLHQWLGVIAAGLAGYHLLVHWAWVKSVTLRLFKRTCGRARICYLMDAGLMLGFVVITVTGLAISTWFELPLDDYLAWKDLHVIASVVTLLIVVVKIGMHWRWVVTVAFRYILPSAAPAGNMYRPQSVSVASAMDRRQFLKLMGGVGAASMFAIGSAVDGMVDAPNPVSESIPRSSSQPSAAATSSAANTQPTSQPSATPTLSAVNTQPTSQPSATPTLSVVNTQPALQPSVAPTLSATNVQPTSRACVVLCSKGCSYPGRCRRYIDTNGNNRCDRGECL